MNKHLLFAFIIAGNSAFAAGPLPPKEPIGNEVPGVSLQDFRPLPQSQRIFRIKAVRAIDGALVAASRAALNTYDSGKPEAGWRKYEVPRPMHIFGSSITVVLLKVDEPGKIIEVAIRGTATLDDVLKDLDAKAELDDQLDIPLHAGFRNIAKGVISLLREKFPVGKYSEYNFKLYGHSLGGAVAAIVSMYLHEDGRTVSLVATFGAPRFTTNEGARKYQVLNQVTFRVVRCDDVIPFLPPPNFLGWSTGSYESNGNLLLLLRPPYFDYSVGIDIERDFVYQLRVELSNTIEREKLAFGHRMGNYKSSLFYYSSEGIVYWPTPGDIAPVSYQQSLQSKLCPRRLAEK